MMMMKVFFLGCDAVKTHTEKHTAATFRAEVSPEGGSVKKFIDFYDTIKFITMFTTAATGRYLKPY
jgi:hypothetical protein